MSERQRITVDGKTFALANRDVLYVGRCGEKITLESDDPGNPAWFYMNSVPAGADIPHRLITKAQAKPLDLGDERRANRRTLRTDGRYSQLSCSFVGWSYT